MQYVHCIISSQRQRIVPVGSTCCKIIFRGYREITVPIQGFSDFTVGVQMIVSVIAIKVSVYRKHSLII